PCCIETPEHALHISPRPLQTALNSQIKSAIHSPVYLGCQFQQIVAPVSVQIQHITPIMWTKVAAPSSTFNCRQTFCLLIGQGADLLKPAPSQRGTMGNYFCHDIVNQITMTAAQQAAITSFSLGSPRNR